MTNHTLEILEYGRVCSIISDYCITAEGKEACKSKKPLADKKEIEEEKMLGADFLALIEKSLEPPLKFLPPVLPFLDETASGKTPEIEGIYSAGLYAKLVKELKEWAEQTSEKEKGFTNKILCFVQEMPDLKDIYKEVFSFIDENGNIKAVPSLQKINKKIAEIEAEIESSMHSFFRNEHTRTMLQSAVPVLKNNRQVLAVQSNFKGRIKGIIHEYSQSGQTFYLEPEEIILKNNNLIEAQAEYNRELLRLLRGIGKTVNAHSAEIRKAAEAITALDCTAAASKWAHKNKCVFASVPLENSICLNKARHPLLENCVPIDLKLLNGTRALIITGPNTGGKTVTLKTAALLALINQTGWAIPAEKGSMLPIFNFIACDIGDEQSLDQSLSTFSAHMKNIAAVIRQADCKSLVILDELGSGTDPEEGGAIAMAVLDELLEKESLVLVTTHHGSLKNYGYTKKHCINASVEFNTGTLSPTYRIVMGIPGESRAVEIARKNGLPENIINRAEKYLGTNQADISALIKELVEKHKALDEFELAKQKEEIYIAETRRKIDLKLLQLKQKELEIQSGNIRSMNSFFKEKRRELENLVREVQENYKQNETGTHVKKWIEDFENKLKEETEYTDTEKTKLQIRQAQDGAQGKPGSACAELKTGSTVRSKSFGKTGQILHKNKNGSFLVAFGSMKINAEADDLEPLEAVNNNYLKPVIHIETAEKPLFELRLLGMRRNEAEAALENQLDNALVHNIKEFTVIHGKGDGVLQKLTYDKFEKNPFVEEIRFARPEHGGTGKSIIVLK